MLSHPGELPSCTLSMCPLMQVSRTSLVGLFTSNRFLGCALKSVVSAGMGAKLTTYYRRKSPTDNEHQRLLTREMLPLLLLLMLLLLLLPAGTAC